MRTLPEPEWVEIADLAHDGRGVARTAGKVMFVPDTLPGERVRVQRRRANRKFDLAEVLEIEQASAQRVTPGCEHFGLCGGCVLQHLDADAQVLHKQTQLAQTLRRIGKVEPQTWLPALRGPSWGYRRRARLGVKYVHAKGRVLVGFRERNGRYVADLQRCPVLVGAVGEKIAALAELIAGLSIREQLPQIEVAAGDESVALVLRVLAPPTAQDLERLESFGREHDLWFYLQTGGLDTVQPLLPQTPPLFYRLPQHDVCMQFQPTDFVQINAQVNQGMIDLALQLLDINAEDELVDLFCGLGNFSLPMARKAARVVGIEGDAGLVARASANAQANGIANAHFLQRDLYSDALSFEGFPACSKLLLDPPRAGALQILPWVAKARPRKIVYVSCHPASLARDAEQLVHSLGYRLTQAGALDMFPHTHHVEAIALFEQAGG